MTNTEFDPIDSTAFLSVLGAWVIERAKNGDPIPDRDTIDILKRGFRAGFHYGESE